MICLFVQGLNSFLPACCQCDIRSKNGTDALLFIYLYGYKDVPVELNCFTVTSCISLKSLFTNFFRLISSKYHVYSLMYIPSLRFFKKIHKFALCEFMPYALSYFISLVRFFGYFCPIWLMRILANAIFFSRTKSGIRQEPSVCRKKNGQLRLTECHR